MRLGLILYGAIFAVAASFLSLAAVSPVQADGGKISNVFVETDLRQALQDIAAQGGVNIIPDPSVQGTVTVGLQGVSVDKALQLVLTGTPFLVKKTPDYYLVYSPDQTADMFPQVAKTRVVDPKFVPPDKVRALLPDTLQRYVRVDSSANTLAITAPPTLMDRIIEDIGKIDQPPSTTTDVVPLNYVKAADAVNLLPEDLQRYVRVDSDRNMLAVSGPLSVHDRILRQLAAIDVPRAPGSFDLPDSFPTHVVKLNNASAKTTLAMLPTKLQTYVSADDATNTLAVSAPPILVGEIERDVRALDVQRKHIMLDARVVSLETSDLLNFGGQWTMPTLRAGTVAGDAVKWPWELAIGYSPDREFTDALSLTLNLLSENNEATIIASPKVLAQDGKEADIQATTEEYFPITTASGAYVQTSLEKIQTGTILKITPQIGNDGDITLDMDIEVSDVVGRGDQNLPVVNRRTAHSTVQIQNGGTAAIAGLVDTRSQSGDAGIPGFANVPILGSAFRTKTLDQQTRQVAVFITATIVSDHDPDFRNGASPPAPARVADPNIYRQRLSNALQVLEAAK